MIRLGITGGIGSGKSYVSCVLQEMGIAVYDTDSRAKQLTLSHPSIRKGLIDLLGENVYQDGRLNRSLVAEYLFASPENAKRINALIHPRVYDDFCEWAAAYQAQGADIVAMECAILFEAGFECAVDKVLMVSAPFEIRLRRAMERDHASEQQIRARMAAQMSDEEKLRRSDYVVINDGIREVKPQLEELLQAVRNGNDGKEFR